MGNAVSGRLDLDALRAATAAGELDTVLVAFVDMQGRLIGKRYQAEYFVDTGHREAHACDYLLANDIEMEPVPGYAAASWQQGYGDFVLKPDLATLRRVPWLEGTALVICDVLDHHGAPVPHSPRAMLLHMAARLAERGLTAMMASELEFYLFDDSFEAARDKHYQDLAPAGHYIEDYHIFQTTKEEAVMRAIRTGLQGADVPVENTKGEWGPGQAEINVRYADALTMADRHAILKNACKEIAWAQGQAVTFMAKWRDDLAGNSCHIHQSLWQDGSAAFADPADPHGMSGTMKAYLAGLLKYAPDITWFLAPYLNSYKRFVAGTFAPTHLVWSVDNRTAAFRLVGHGDGIRIENRIGGADLNAHLAFAAQLAAGLAGIEEGPELPPPFAGDAYADDSLAQVPTTLRAAIETLDGSTMLRAAFGDAVVNHYVHTARWEQAEADRRVTDFDLKRGFERA